jgi:putative hydrolase of the HAD superfamily
MTPETTELLPMNTSAKIDVLQAVRAIVFDFDGLICDTEGAQVRAARNVFAAHDATLPLDRWIQLIGTATNDDFWVPWLEEQTGRVDRKSVVREFLHNNEQEVAKLVLNPGVIALLDAAAELHVPVAIASSSPSEWVVPIARRFGIESRFVTIVCREHAPRAKPAPDLYVEALRRLEIKPGDSESAVALEDSRNGSLAAKAARMSCIAIPGALTKAQDFSHVDHVVDSMIRVRLGTQGELRIV